MRDVLRQEIDARGVATLWMARPDKHNALSAELIEALHAAAVGLGDDPDIRVVVLAGEGPSFCAGGDLGWMRTQIAADTATRAEAARTLAAMLGALNTLPKPLIARVHGNAFGGGIGLMSVCDAVVAVDGLTFALTETRLGLIPATIGPYVIARLGSGAARRVFMNGRRFETREARTFGLVGRIATVTTLDEEVEAEVAPYLKCAPGAVAAAKTLVHDLGGGVSQADIDHSVAALVAQWETDEAREGVEAFFDKRRPNWVR